MAKPVDKNRKIRLSQTDWEMLLPGRVLTFGTTMLEIRPLGLEDFAGIIRRVTVIKDDLVVAGINLENYSQGEGLMKLTTLLVDKIPDVLSDATDLVIEDIKKLPLSSVMSLISAVIEVNIESQEGLLKNFGTLAENVSALVGSISGKPLNSSLKTDIAGETLKVTPLEK